MNIEGEETVIQTFDQMLAFAATLPPKRVAVVAPVSADTFDALRDAVQALNVGLVCAGDGDLIRRELSARGVAAGQVTILPADGARAALRGALDAVREGRADILMKGGVDTATMMRGVLDAGAGLRTGKLLSDIFVLEYPPRAGNKFIMITDGGMTLAPDLKNKMALIENAVAVAHALGNTLPKVAVLSATEFVVPGLQSTLDAAALSKMNERGQITGCVVDGPFALDNAISVEAAAEKRIRSEVAGNAEILVAANIESANSLAKSTTYFAGLRLAHVIVGGRAPILIPSRADKADARLLSIALGAIMSARGVTPDGD